MSIDESVQVNRNTYCSSVGCKRLTEETVSHHKGYHNRSRTYEKGNYRLESRKKIDARHPVTMLIFQQALFQFAAEKQVGLSSWVLSISRTVPV